MSTSQMGVKVQTEIKGKGYVKKKTCGQILENTKGKPLQKVKLFKCAIGIL